MLQLNLRSVMPCLKSEIPYLMSKYFCDQVDRSSEEPDGEADRTNHYAEGGSGTKGTSPGKQNNAGSESPKPGRRRHSRRSSQDFEMMMRAESAGPGGGHVCPSYSFQLQAFFFSFLLRCTYTMYRCPHVSSCNRTQGCLKRHSST